jgi:hypothetical protein
MYVNPFDIDDLSDSIERLVFPGNPALRHQMVERGAYRIRRYRYSAISRQWLTLCEEIRRQGGGRRAGQLKLGNLNLSPADGLDSLMRAAG